MYDYGKFYSEALSSFTEQEKCGDKQKVAIAKKVTDVHGKDPTNWPPTLIEDLGMLTGE